MTTMDAPAPLLPEILALHGRWRANHPALICDEVSETWSEFTRNLNRCANSLLAGGVATGERVAVVMSNSAGKVHALFGIMTAGAVSVPINLSISDDAMLALILDSGARTIIASTDQHARLDAMRERLGDAVKRFVLYDEAAPGWVAWTAFLYRGADASPRVSVGATDLLNIIYSSGTTGTPKGIAHTHRGRLDWAYDLAIALRYHSGARVLLTIGLYSNISWAAMLCALLAGGTLVVHRRFDPLRFLETVGELGITHTAMVPVQFQRVVELMCRHDYDVRSMQAMMCCGSPLPASLKQELFQRFPCGVIELYGLTEGVITTLDPEDAPGRWSSVGRPLLGTDIRILDQNDREAPRGEAGEIVSRGRIAMSGYFQRPDATAAVVWRDEHGREWLRTGDIGRLDAENFLYIVDRKKDLIISGGQNVYPQDIEAVLMHHPNVSEAAVIGVPSQRWGETPVAIVVPRESEHFDPTALRAWCNERVGKHQRIVAVISIEALPRNANGKILKRELRTQFSGHTYE
jgi:acyl-CoA synthetase (AMP-forming)/AMP-acid ligase II